MALAGQIISLARHAEIDGMVLSPLSDFQTDVAKIGASARAEIKRQHALEQINLSRNRFGCELACIIFFIIDQDRILFA